MKPFRLTPLRKTWLVFGLSLMLQAGQLYYYWATFIHHTVKKILWYNCERFLKISRTDAQVLTFKTKSVFESSRERTDLRIKTLLASQPFLIRRSQTEVVHISFNKNCTLWQLPSLSSPSSTTDWSPSPSGINQAWRNFKVGFVTDTASNEFFVLLEQTIILREHWWYSNKSETYLK